MPRAVGVEQMASPLTPSKAIVYLIRPARRDTWSMTTLAFAGSHAAGLSSPPASVTYRARLSSVADESRVETNLKEGPGTEPPPSRLDRDQNLTVGPAIAGPRTRDQRPKGTSAPLRG